MQALVGYFGEQRAEPCGHCTHCLSGSARAAAGERAARRPRRSSRRPASRGLRAEHPEALGQPRQLARFLCGLSSPATTRERLSRHELYGALARHRFADVLALCGSARARECSDSRSLRIVPMQTWMGESSSSGTRPTVLVCDDEPVLRMLVRATLDQGNYTVVEACDGDEAIARTRSDRPDLILLDMMMPGRSGSDVLRELRADPATANDPGDHATARAQATDREAMNLAGARSLPDQAVQPGWAGRARRRGAWRGERRPRPPSRRRGAEDAHGEAPENRTNASLERENTALGLESDELKAQQVTMEAQQVTMEAHQVTMQAHQVTLERLVDINRALLDASVDGIRLVDLEGRSLLANSVIEHLTTEIFGLPRYSTLQEGRAIADRLPTRRPTSPRWRRSPPIRTAPRRTTSSWPTSGAPSSATPGRCATRPAS